jgi:hypothetical protein
MISKIFYWVSTLLQALLLITAWGIQYFSMKKMGMMRYILYINREWAAQYPIAALQYSAIAFLVLLSVVLILYAKTKQVNYFTDKKFVSMLAAGVIITFAFVFFSLAYSTDSYRSYYFISMILAITALIQDIKIFVHLKRQD